MAAGTVTGIDVSSTNTSGHYVWTSKIHATWADFTANVIGLRMNYLNGVLTIRNFKLEVGNVPTDWTPAPEDAPSNDAQLVHKTGNETVAGDKTFTGIVTATNVVETGTPRSVTTTSTLNGLTFSFTRVGSSVYVTTHTTAVTTAIQAGWYSGIIPTGYRPVDGVEMVYLQKPSAGGYMSTSPSGRGYFNSALAVGDIPRIAAYYPTTDAWPNN